MLEAYAGTRSAKEKQQIPTEIQFFLNFYIMIESVRQLSCVWLFETPWTITHQAHPSMGFSRQEYWSGLPCPPPGDLPKPGIEPLSLMSPALTGRFFTTSSTLGFSVLHCLAEFAQIHVHWVSDAIPPSCPLFFLLSIFPSIRSFPMSQFITPDGQSIGASVPASILPMNIQGWFPLGMTGLISLQSRTLQESSPAPQFKSINSLLLSFLYGPTLTSAWLLEKP